MFFCLREVSSQAKEVVFVSRSNYECICDFSLRLTNWFRQILTLILLAITFGGDWCWVWCYSQAYFWKTLFLSLNTAGLWIINLQFIFAVFTLVSLRLSNWFRLILTLFHAMNFEAVSCRVWFYSQAEWYVLKSLFPSLNVTGLWVIPNLNFRFIFAVVCWVFCDILLHLERDFTLCYHRKSMTCLH